MIMLSVGADQRTDLQQEVNELKQTLASNDKGRKELIDSSKRLKDQLNQAVVSPPWPGYTRLAGFSLHFFLPADFKQCVSRLCLGQHALVFCKHFDYFRLDFQKLMFSFPDVKKFMLCCVGLGMG